MLQRWEPVVSDSFPSIISFWIRIHGIPLHYWTEEALEAIGSELGRVESKDVHNGRVRVSINGLLPLERHLEISLPSGEIKEVELEYEKLEKHCFSCQSLSHDQDHCTARTSSAQASRSINQERTLDRLAERRRGVDRSVRSVARPERPDKHAAIPGPRRPYHENDDRRIRYSKPSSDRDFRNDHRAVSADFRRRPPVSPPRRTETANREVWVPRKDLPSVSVAASDPRGSGRLSVRTARQHSASHSSHTPPPRPQREPIQTPPGTGSARNTSKDRRPALERISPVVSVNVSSERRPAMERISLPPNGEPLPLYEDGATNPAPLHEVEGHYFDEIQGDRPFYDKIGASGSKLPHSDLSPIRSLSEDRLHVSRRLGPVPAEPEVTISLPMGPPLKRSGRIAAKVLGKRKPPAQTAKKRVDSSPVQGTSIKRRRITKVLGSPKRKLGLSTVGAKTGAKAGASTSRAAPSIKVFPASKKKVADFRPPQNPLP